MFIMTPPSGFFPNLSGGVWSLSPQLPGYLRAPGKLVQPQGPRAGLPESSPRLLANLSRNGVQPHCGAVITSDQQMAVFTSPLPFVSTQRKGPEKPL